MQGYKLPSYERMRNTLIPDVSQQTKDEVDKIILVCSSLTVILDIWSTKSMQGYIGFTIVCVTQDFKRFTIFLCVKQMLGRHTADNILAEYEQVLRDWNIPREKVCV